MIVVFMTIFLFIAAISLLFCPACRWNFRISGRKRSRRLIISCKDSKNSEVGSISAAGVRRTAEFPCQSAVDRQNSAADGVGQIGPKPLIYKGHLASRGDISAAYRRFLPDGSGNY